MKILGLLLFILMEQRIIAESCHRPYNVYGYNNGPSYRDDRTIECTNVELPLQRKPELYNYEYLTIALSNIRTIPPSAFFDCCNSVVTELQMNDVNVIDIEPGAFNGLQQLTNLSLHNNQIEIITRGIFNSLNNLQSLDLSSNNIGTIEAKSFTGLNNLTTLLLNANNLTNLESNLFEDLKSLKYLDLSNNFLQSINLKFLNLQQLNIAVNQLQSFEINLRKLPVVAVDLSNNEITSIDLALFPLLRQIDLSKNRLSTLENWPTFVCNDINLNYNQLEEIGQIDSDTIIFRANHNNLTNLERLIGSVDDFYSANLLEFDVGFNAIERLNKDIFVGFQSLTKLYLQHNQIKRIESGCFRNLNGLKILDLSSNQLDYLPYGLFDQLINLEILNLSHNHLTNFNYYSLNSLNVLNQLYLDHNLIKSFNGNDLSFYLVNLRQISLDGNKFYCEDLAKLFHILNKSNIAVLFGDTFDEENVKGIPCYTDLHNLKRNNDDFYNSSLYRFFQSDFQKTNFVKFLHNYKDNDNTNETVANFDYLYPNRLYIDGNNYKRDPLIVGVLIFFAIIVFLLTINFYVTKRHRPVQDRIVNC